MCVLCVDQPMLVRYVYWLFSGVSDAGEVSLLRERMESLKSDVNRVPFLTESEFIWAPAVITNVHNKGASYDVDLLCCAGSDYTVRSSPTVWLFVEMLLKDVCMVLFFN